MGRKHANNHDSWCWGLVSQNAFTYFTPFDAHFDDKEGGFILILVIGKRGPEKERDPP
jgi:hypothetical protein